MAHDPRVLQGRKPEAGRMTQAPSELEAYAAQIEELAQRLGLDYYPGDFEAPPASLMTKIAVYGLPIRLPHWSFGVASLHQLVRRTMAPSRICEWMVLA